MAELRRRELSGPGDDLNIAGWYIPADESQTADKSSAIVMVHGWNASRTNGFNQDSLPTWPSGAPGWFQHLND